MKENLKELQISFLWGINKLTEVYLKESGKSTTLEEEALLRNICDFSEPEEDTVELHKMLIEDISSLVDYMQKFILFSGWNLINRGLSLEVYMSNIFVEHLRNILFKADKGRTEIAKSRNHKSIKHLYSCPCFKSNLGSLNI